MTAAQVTQKIRVGLSACLAGDEVRYNGQAAEDRFVTGSLSEYFEYVKVCPEMAIGMGTPRETVRIVDDNGLHLRNREGTNDYTEKMVSFSRSSASKMNDENLCGFIFKKGSPSCGAFRVKRYHPEGHTLRADETGFYAAEIRRKMPWLPVEEDGRLNDPALRYNFISRVFAMDFWRKNVEANCSIKSLVDFHARHKYMLMSHHQNYVSELGRLVANKDRLPPEEVADKYLHRFFEITEKPASSKKHANVLYHLFGYFSGKLDEFDRKETVSLIEEYRNGLLPLVTPVKRISHYVKKFKVDYLMNQAYLDYPEDLCVLNRL